MAVKRKPFPGMERSLFCGSLTQLPDMSVTLFSLKMLITHRVTSRDSAILRWLSLHCSQTSPSLWLAGPAVLPGPDIAHADTEDSVSSGPTFTTTSVTWLCALSCHSTKDGSFVTLFWKEATVDWRGTRKRGKETKDCLHLLWQPCLFSTANNQEGGGLLEMQGPPAGGADLPFHTGVCLHCESHLPQGISEKLGEGVRKSRMRHPVWGSRQWNACLLTAVARPAGAVHPDGAAHLTHLTRGLWRSRVLLQMEQLSGGGRDHSHRSKGVLRPWQSQNAVFRPQASLAGKGL